MAKSPEEMAASMKQNMEAKTGKKLSAWLKITAKSGLEKHGQLVKHLKDEHGMTHGFANMVAAEHLNKGKAAPGSDELVEAQYAGPKSELRPIYDALIDAVSRFGSDVEVAPKKAYVSLRRNKQFAIFQPSTKTRLDVGINLKEVEPTDRLEAAGSFNSMVTHRVRLSSRKEVNRELVGWLKQAYGAS